MSSNIITHRIESAKTKNILSGIVSVLSFVSHLALLTLLVVGIFDVYGKKVSIIESINLLLNIRDYWLVSVCSVTIAIIYYVVLISIIKKCISSAKNLKKSFSNKPEDDSLSAVEVISINLSYGVFNMILLLVLSQIIEKYEFNIYTVVALAVFMFICIISKIIVGLLRGQSVLEILLQTITFILSLCAIVVLLYLFGNIDIKQVFDDISYFIKGVSTFLNTSNEYTVVMLFECLLKPILYFTIIVSNLVAAKSILVEEDEESKASKTLWQIIVFVVISIIVSVFIGTVSDAASLFSAAKDYISSIACALLLFIATRINKFPAVRPNLSVEEK